MDPNGRNRRKRGQAVHGWVVLDKPLGLGSTKAVSVVRRLFDAQKAGHAGTLDPLATGVLPIALGEATKTVPFLMDAAKGYDFTIQWGEHRETLDAEGDIVATSDVRPNEAQIEAVLPRFIGEIEQIPPKYSAIKIDGKRAYDLARAGADVVMKTRHVRIDGLSLIQTGGDSASFHVDCGKGTYVRSLARDIANALGALGYVSFLRRTRVGPFTLAQSFPLDALDGMDYAARATEALQPLSTALDDIPVLAVSETNATLLKQGRDIMRPADTSFTDELVLMECGGVAICLGQPRGQRIYPKRVFNI
jgi:tRNA pseudouridine55 synthase